MLNKAIMAGIAATLLMLQGCAVDQRKAPVIDPTHNCPIPAYPAISRRMEEQGTVVVRFLVSPQGMVLNSEIGTSSGFPRLDKAAQDALSQCHFIPAQLNGHVDPEPQWAPVRFTWRLDAALPSAH